MQWRIELIPVTLPNEELKKWNPLKREGKVFLRVVNVKQQIFHCFYTNEIFHFLISCDKKLRYFKVHVFYWNKLKYWKFLWLLVIILWNASNAKSKNIIGKLNKSWSPKTKNKEIALFYSNETVMMDSLSNYVLMDGF